MVWAGLLLAAAVALRFHRLGQNSLWVDEYASLVTAKLPFAKIPAGALSGDAFEPPLYFWLLHLAIGLFGESETALRLLSAVAGAVTVPLLVLLLRDLGQSAGGALLAGGLLALSPLHLWYSQEARPYALFVCLGLGSLVCLVRALHTNAALPWIGFAGLAALAILTHVVALIFPLVGWMWAVRARRDGSVLRPLLAATMVIVLVTAPFAYRLAHAVSHAQSTGSPPRRVTGLEIPYTVFTYALGYSFGPSVREIQDEGAWASLARHPVESSLGTVAILCLVALVLRLRGHAAKSLGLLAVAPMAVTWLGSVLSGKAYNVRYALPGVIGFLGLVALGISRLREPRRWIAAVLVAGLFLWADGQWFIATRYRKEDSRSAVAWLQARLPAGATVGVAPGYQAEVLTYYAGRAGANFAFAQLPDTISSLPSPLPDALLITRLHHLPHWSDVVRELELRGGRTPEEADLVGYRAILFRH